MKNAIIQQSKSFSPSLKLNEKATFGTGLLQLKAGVMDLPQNTKSKLVQINHISMNENEKVKIRPERYKI
jgi:hypothetical protein